MNNIKTKFRRLGYQLRHDILAIENVVLILAITLCFTWTYQSILAMSRNWELSERLTTERKNLELLTLEVESAELENEYYKTEEYQELMARKHFDKKFTGEQMLVLPENSESAKSKHVQANTAPKDRSYQNIEKWFLYLFPNY